MSKITKKQSSLLFQRQIFCLLPIFIIAATSIQAEWNQWRGPQRNGIISGQPWPQKISETNLNKVWSKELSPSYSSPVVGDGLIFTTETIDKKTEMVKAFDLESGELKWERSWEGAIKVPFFAAANGSWIRSTPLYDSGKVYVSGIRDRLVCLNANDGAIVWNIDFPKETNSAVPTFGCVASPLIEGDYLYTQIGDSLAKINKNDGSIMWQSLRSKGGMMGSAFSSPVIGELHGTKQLIVQTREELAGVTFDNGQVLWKIKIPHFRGMNILTPTVMGNKVFTSSYRNKNVLVDIQHEGDSWKPTETWTTRGPAYMSSPILHDGFLYQHLQSQRISCTEVSTGLTTWISEKRFGKYWSMIAQNDKILALDEKGVLYHIKANPEKFEIIEERKVSDAPTWAHLGISGNKLLIRELNALTVHKF